MHLFLLSLLILGTNVSHFRSTGTVALEEIAPYGELAQNMTKTSHIKWSSTSSTISAFRSSLQKGHYFCLNFTTRKGSMAMAHLRCIAPFSWPLTKAPFGSGDCHRSFGAFWSKHFPIAPEYWPPQWKFHRKPSSNLAVPQGIVAYFGLALLLARSRFKDNGGLYDASHSKLMWRSSLAEGIGRIETELPWFVGILCLTSGTRARIPGIDCRRIIQL